MPAFSLACQDEFAHKPARTVTEGKVHLALPETGVLRSARRMRCSLPKIPPYPRRGGACSSLPSPLFGGEGGRRRRSDEVFKNYPKLSFRGALLRRIWHCHRRTPFYRPFLYFPPHPSCKEKTPSPQGEGTGILVCKGKRSTQQKKTALFPKPPLCHSKRTKSLRYHPSIQLPSQAHYNSTYCFSQSPSILPSYLQM